MGSDVIGIAARLKPEDEARRLKARWALSLRVWNSGGADEYWKRACRNNPLPFLSSARKHGWSDFARLLLL
jgi:hypothetical protein